MTAPAFKSKWSDWNLKTPSQRTDSADSLQSVSTVGSLNRHSDPEFLSVDSLTEDQRERFEERAAIMEFDGGLSRQDAEQSALHDIIGDN